MAEQMNSVELQRQRERAEDLTRRRQVARLEADALNLHTLQAHAKEKIHAVDIKERYRKHNNTYAPDAVRHAALRDQMMKERGTSLSGLATRTMQVKDMPTTTGITSSDPNRLTTIRQVRHYEDNKRRIEQDQAKKAAFRADLEK